MRRNIWIISDTHFGHENIIKYCDRPFANVDEMDKVMVANWNDTVKEEDIVYHLGDVYFRKSWMLPLLKGRKRLILGNHDNGKDQNLLDHFQKILVWRMFPEFGLLLTHVPVHESVVNGEKCPVNVHGHIHNNREIFDKRYKNVSVEMIDYRPVNIEELAVRR
jgi:calcineurin-like phosphoesterase family protein